MKKTANARFTIAAWDEKPWSEAADRPKLTRASVAKVYSGDLEGEGRVEYLMMYRADGSATIVGLEYFSGRLADRDGSFVLRRAGAFESGQAKESYSVVEGSATGELRGLRGEGQSALGHATEYPFTLAYEIE